MSVFEEVLTEVNELVGARANWDDEDTVPIYCSQETADRTTFVLGVIAGQGIICPDVVLAPNGDIALDWQRESFSFLLRISGDECEPLKFTGRRKDNSTSVSGNVRTREIHRCLDIWKAIAT